MFIMKKLTSADIKNLFIPKLSKIQPFPNFSKQEDINRWCDYLNLPIGITASDFGIRATKIWLNPKQWIRTEKARLKAGCAGEPHIQYDSETGLYEYYCYDDGEGGSQEVIKKCYENEKYKDECWQRVFVPNNIFGDSYRVEVLTTPDDFELVGWEYIVD
jgi:hypothetical protein